jgi:hypothetical protein
MRLQVEQYYEYQSAIEQRCDATTYFFENEERKELCFTHNEVAALFHARHSRIFINDAMVTIQFFDADSKEFLFLNCRKAIHELMVKYLLYPTIISKLFIQ